MKLYRLQKRAISMALSSELAYKGNFILKCAAMALLDLVGPLLTLLIYNTTQGIPGWSFYELLLFQGTLILVFGLGSAFVLDMPFEVIDVIRGGEFDFYLTRPYNTLLYTIATSFDMDGLAEIVVGLAIVTYSMAKLGISILTTNFLMYLVFVVAGFLVQVAVMTLVSSLAFLVVKSDALMHLYFKISDFVRYPITIYHGGIVFALTFLLPLAVSSFYPAKALLGRLEPLTMLVVLIPVVLFVALSVLLWNAAMKRYTSAGG